VPAFVRALGSGAEHHGQQGGVGLLEYCSIFDNGLPAPATIWGDRGIQQELVCTRRWGQDHGHSFRPWIGNLRMRGTQTSLQEMIAKTEKALLVASFWYVRASDASTLMLTGLTRDGVFLIENGEVVGSVNNFRFGESPVGALSRTTEVGTAVTTLSREYSNMSIAAPPIRVEEFFMSSVSDAV
jgi:predicted Zn-dependent protease